jgi:hypothetical protein
MALAVPPAIENDFTLIRLAVEQFAARIVQLPGVASDGAPRDG